jgi:TIR domain
MPSDDRLVNVFISYAHEDRKWCTRLRDQLGALVNLGHIHLFDDGEIGAGEKWDDRIRQELDSADIIVLIVSDKFMSSKYSTTVELQRAIKGHASKSVCVIPVVADHVDVDALPFRNLQFFPLDENRDLKPLVDWKDEVSRPLADIARSIRKEAERIKGAPTAPMRPDRAGPAFPETRTTRWRWLIGGAVIVAAVVAALMVWKSEPRFASGSPSDGAASGDARQQADQQKTDPPMTDNRASGPSSRDREIQTPQRSTGTGRVSAPRTSPGNKSQPVATGDRSKDPPSGTQPPVVETATQEPLPNQTQSPSAPAAAQDPEQIRQQLFARASALVQCVLQNKDETSAVRILRILKTSPSSFTTTGILADLKSAWPGAATETQQREIVRQINCIPIQR